MGHYIVNRLVQTFVVIFGVSLISFGVTFATGDPAYLLVGPQATQEQIDTLRHELGFDRPWPIQYLDYMSRAVRGDFGVSLRSHEPAFGLIMSRMPLTLELAGAALLLSLLIAVPVGILSATRRNTLFDTFAMLGALLGQSMPAFWLGLMLILIFGVELRWFPISGAGDIQHLVLPAITLGAFGAARNARLIRSSVLDTLSNDYVRTATAKGLSQSTVMFRHVIKNSMLPVITVIGLDLGVLLGGAVITETIFAWPGVGRLIVQSIETKDYPLIQTAVILLAVLFVMLNLLVDLTYTYLDPRIRLT
ncbi:MAG TPA: nickel ABC transporter permease [Chloroflexota bacterium]|jgi:peptide/nickel transport system permease protein